MRIMKKVALLLIACLLVFGLIYGVMWIGDTPVSAEISQEAKGQFVRMEGNGKKLIAAYEGMEKIYPVADNVWVYRNSQKAGIPDLQKGDTLEIILNNKSQAAYIKASGGGTVASAAEPAMSAPSAPPAADLPVTPTGAAATPGATQAGSTLPPNGSAPAAAASPAVPGPSAVKAAASGGWPWERLSLELKSRELVFKVKHEQTDKGYAADIYVQSKDRAVVHLNGAEAEKMLRLMLQGLPADRAAWEQALKQRLGAEFKLKDASPEWKLDIRWKDEVKAVSLPPVLERPHPEPQVKGYEKEQQQGSKEKEKVGDTEKDKQKGKAHGREQHDQGDD